QYTAPAWVLIYSVARGIQKATLQRLGAVAFALAGTALVVGLLGSGKLHFDAIGVVAAILAAFSFGFYNVLVHHLLTRHDRWIVLLYTTGSASLFWMAVNSPSRILAEHYSSGQWIFLFGFSLVSVLVPFSFYFAGLQHLEPTRAIVASCLEPV